MNIKRITDYTINFIIQRLIELIGILIVIFGVLLFISLISYSPDDPNFIFPENLEIKNFLGFKGSFTADLFFQSVGLISYLIPITLIFTGINIFKYKLILLIVENLFFVVVYSILGSLFFSHFYNDTFNLHVNGNGGFVGLYFDQSIFNVLINVNESISYYLILIFITIIFFISINLKTKNISNFFKENFFSKNRNKNYTNKNEIIEEYIPQEDLQHLQI